MIDSIESDKEIYVLIVEAKRSDLDKAFQQCALVIRDAYAQNNDNVPIYGFMTTGVQWKLIKYDGTQFQLSEDFSAAFPLMKDERERWMRECSKIVDVIYSTLKHH